MQGLDYQTVENVLFNEFRFTVLFADSLYVGYLLKSNHAIKEYILASEQGASIVRRNLDMQLFGEIKFSVPDITRQRKFSHLLNEVDLLIQKYSSELMLLEKTKIYLLQQLFI